MKLDRLMGILVTLLRCDSITAPELARKFEVSRRTISRDVDALCQAGVPVVTRQGGGGGISIAEGYKLDKSVLTTDELSGITAALKGLGSVTEPSQIERTLDKLHAKGEAVVSLRDSIVIDLASHYQGSLTGKIGRIREAIRDSRRVMFDYFYEKGEARRVIEPHYLTFHWTAWYVFGFCLDRQDFRLFKLSRLWNLEMLAEAFIPREIPPEKRDLDARFTDHNRLVALFDPRTKYQLIETYGPHSFSEQADGKLLLDIGYTSRDYIVGWLLGFGDGARVLAPEDMAEEIRRIAEKMVERYR